MDWVFLLLVIGALGVPTVLVFAIFYSTLGPEPAIVDDRPSTLADRPVIR